MFKTNGKTCEEKSIHAITSHKEHNKLVLWIKMHDILHKLGVKTCLIWQ